MRKGILLLIGFVFCFAFVKAQDSDSVTIKRLDPDTFTIRIDTNLKVDTKPNQFRLNYLYPKTYTIEKINVEGTIRDSRAVMLRSGLAVGDRIRIPGDEISGAIKKLWEANIFTDVQIYAEKVKGDKITLLFKVKEKPQVSNFGYRGIDKKIKRSEKEELGEVLNFVLNHTITPNLVFKAEKIIREYFEDKRYLFVKINTKEVVDSSKVNKAILVFEIERGKKVRIQDIVFKGNRAISDKKLRKTMDETKRYKWWSNVFKASKYVPETYADDKKLVEQEYLRHGFRDVKIVWDTVKKVNDKRVEIVMRIDEGKRYYYRNINFSGNNKYTSVYLKKLLGIKKGDIYNAEKLQQRLSMDPTGTDLSSLYLDDGYLFFNVRPVETTVKGDSVDLDIRIYEGKQAIVGNITVEGNTKTSDHVILREIYTKPGELFKRSDIIRSQRELSQLKYFDPQKMNVIPSPNPQDGTVDIKYIVAEQPSDQFELQGGYGAGTVIGTLGLSFNNFSANKFFQKKAWNPIPAGDGQTLSLRAQSNGRFYQGYNFSFVEPWLGGKKPLAFSLGGNHTRLNTSTGGHLFISGGSIGLGTRLRWPDNFFRLQGTLNYSYYDTKDYSSIDLGNGFYNNLSFRFSLTRNSIDQPLYPRSGAEFSFIHQFTLPYSLFKGEQDYKNMPDQQKFKWLEYHKYRFHFGWYNNIVDKLVLYTKVNFGVLGGYNRNIGISPFERFYMGGSGLSGFNIDGREIIPLRGFPDASGNNQVFETGAEKGGVAAVKYTMELRYPISLEQQATIYALAFMEAGNTYGDLKQFDPFDVKKASGVGIRLFLPMLGMLGFDYGFPFDNRNPVFEGQNMNPFNNGQFTFTFGGNISGW